MKAVIYTIIFILSFSTAQAVDKGYIFYLHGAIVQQQGADAVSTTYGKYEYDKIVQTFSSYGYHVISEVRPQKTIAEEYALKIAAQVDSLLKIGVTPDNITIVGASAGAYITLQAAIEINSPNINYVLMGICTNSIEDSYSGKKLCGNYYSIYETSDFAGSCNSLLNNRDCESNFQELPLNTGKRHGFLYQPYDEWVQPMMNWIDEMSSK